MTDPPTGLPAVAATNAIRPTEAGTDRTVASSAPPSNLAVAAEVVRVLESVSSGQHRLEAALDLANATPAVRASLPERLTLQSPRPYPAGTLLLLELNRTDTGWQAQIVEATPPAASGSVVATTARAEASSRDRAVAILRRHGVPHPEKHVEVVARTVREVDARPADAARVVVDLTSRDLPVTPSLIRGGLALRTGLLERDASELGTRLAALVRAHVGDSAERQALLDSIQPSVEALRATGSRVPVDLVTRLIGVIDTVLELLGRGDAERRTLGRVMSGLRAATDRGVDSLESRVRRLVLDPVPSPMRSNGEEALVHGLRDLSPAARMRAVEFFHRLHREHLESKPWFAELRAVARELVARAEALVHLQWLEWGSLDPETTFVGSGVWVDPDGRLPFRLSVRDERDGEGEGLGFRIVVDSGLLGHVEIDGTLAMTGEGLGGLTVDWVADDPRTESAISADLADLERALARHGYEPTVRCRPGSRPMNRPAVDHDGLDLRA